jgi:hypothetical protein
MVKSEGYTSWQTYSITVEFLPQVLMVPFDEVSVVLQDVAFAVVVVFKNGKGNPRARGSTRAARNEATGVSMSSLGCDEGLVVVADKPRGLLEMKNQVIDGVISLE